MEALDGNAIAGDLFEAFGDEMTEALGRCRFCGDVSHVGQLLVYMRAPGAVARCHVCLNVVMVLVSVRGTMRVDASGIEMDAG
jgi:Family of unknown function (DUF6510)